MPAPDLTWIAWPLLAGLLLVDPRPLRLAVAGVLLSGLSIASAMLVLGGVAGHEFSRRIAERGVQPSYLLFNAAILLTGAGLAGAAAVAEWRTRRSAGSVLLALALAATAPLAWPLLRESRPLVALLAATSMVLLLLAWTRWSDGRGTAGLAGAGAWLGAGRSALTWGVLALGALAALAPDAGVMLLAAAALLALLHVGGPAREGIGRLPVLPIAAIVSLAAAWLAWRAAGSDGLATSRISDAAFSPALQTLLGVLLLPLTLVLAGVPPFDRTMPGAALTPVAAAILVRAVLPGVTEGVEHWRSAAALWLVLGAVDAARRRRVPVLLACGALFTLLAGDDAGHAPGMALAVLASLWELVPAFAPRLATAWSGRVALAAALVAWTIALRATLATEVVYSVAMVVVLTVGALRGTGRSADG